MCWTLSRIGVWLEGVSLRYRRGFAPLWNSYVMRGQRTPSCQTSGPYPLSQLNRQLVHARRQRPDDDHGSDLRKKDARRLQEARHVLRGRSPRLHRGAPDTGVPSRDGATRARRASNLASRIPAKARVLVVPYRIEFTESADREFGRLPRGIRQRFNSGFDSVGAAPYRSVPGLFRVHHLRGGEGRWTMIVSRYRGIYRVTGDLVLFDAFRVRPTAYRELGKFPRSA